MKTNTHRVWSLGANIDTDALAPGHAMKFGMEVIAQHCLESVLPEFATQVTHGDVIVAGPDFGIGSSREQAAAVLVHLGVQAVIAPSFSGLFFRNAFNVGLLLLTCPNIDPVHPTRLSFDVNNPDEPLVVTDTQQTWRCEAIPAFLLERVQYGGLLNELRHQLSRNQHDTNHA